MLQRLEAAKAFVRANGLDRVIWPKARKRLGIVSTGKAWLDVMDALAQLGIDEARAAELGIAVYKVAMVWPLEPAGIADFAAGCEQLLVIEEKRPVIEEQVASLLFNLPSGWRPKLTGKRDADGAPLVPAGGELNPLLLARLIGAELLRREPDAALAARLAALEPPVAVGGFAGGQGALMRLPSFCAGCPHNTSTRVPEGSLAMGGIGCHGLATWLPERNTLTLYHMGGEGAAWIGQAPFTTREHLFQNMGDGTYFHSGLLAIRANVAAGTNITYKILVNGAISMTGGQPIEGESFDGGITAPHVAQQLYAEGVQRIALVTEELARHRDRAKFPAVTTFHHRDELDAVQRELREHRGVSAIVYEQACATERKRLRKRGKYPDVAKRYLISEEVCEGCGDCGLQSNCIALEPNETRFGRKRTINQSVCNKDFSCVKGMCPSFVTVYGGSLRGTAGAGEQGLDESLFAALPEPAVPRRGKRLQYPGGRHRRQRHHHAGRAARHRRAHGGQAGQRARHHRARAAQRSRDQPHTLRRRRRHRRGDAHSRGRGGPGAGRGPRGCSGRRGAGAHVRRALRGGLQRPRGADQCVCTQPGPGL